MTFKRDLSDAGDPSSPAYHKELALIMMRHRPELEGKLLVEDTWDWQIVDESTPEPSDLVIRKTRYNGFHRTILEDRLKADDILLSIVHRNCHKRMRGEYSAQRVFQRLLAILVEDAMSHPAQISTDRPRFGTSNMCSAG